MTRPYWVLRWVADGDYFAGYTTSYKWTKRKEERFMFATKSGAVSMSSQWVKGLVSVVRVKRRGAR